jgi:hypothetical protein
MKREVSVLLATTNVDEEKIPIAVMETADMETLRIAVESYILPMYNWGDEQKDEFDEWVDEITDSLCFDSEYKDKSGTDLHMTLHSTLVY